MLEKACGVSTSAVASSHIASRICGAGQGAVGAARALSSFSSQALRAFGARQVRHANAAGEGAGQWIPSLSAKNRLGTGQAPRQPWGKPSVKRWSNPPANAAQAPRNPPWPTPGQCPRWRALSRKFLLAHMSASKTTTSSLHGMDSGSSWDSWGERGWSGLGGVGGGLAGSWGILAGLGVVWAVVAGFRGFGRVGGQPTHPPTHPPNQPNLRPRWSQSPHDRP